MLCSGPTLSLWVARGHGWDLMLHCCINLCNLVKRCPLCNWFYGCPVTGTRATHHQPLFSEVSPNLEEVTFLRQHASNLSNPLLQLESGLLSMSGLSAVTITKGCSLWASFLICAWKHGPSSSWLGGLSHILKTSFPPCQLCCYPWLTALKTLYISVHALGHKCSHFLRMD